MGNSGRRRSDKSRLVVVSDTALLDQRKARRDAYHGVLELLSEECDIPSALIAQAFQNPLGAPRNSTHPPPPENEAQRLQAAAMRAIDHYIAMRSIGTHPPAGMAEALATVRSNLQARGDGSGEAIVGVSSLPPAALDRYLGDPAIHRVLDAVYSAPPRTPAEGASTDGLRNGWIVGLDGRQSWPSAGVLAEICDKRQVSPTETLFIGGNLGEEIAPAMDLGMRAVYVRLGGFDGPAAGFEATGGPAPASMRRPDGIVTRLQDLPRLPCFDPKPSAEAQPHRFQPRDHGR